jgi:carbonic anhydrase
MVALMLQYDGVAYSLQKFVVHTPSEHAFGGQHFPVEIQFIHAASIQGVNK